MVYEREYNEIYIYNINKYGVEYISQNISHY